VLANMKDTRSDEEKVTELFLWAFARKPSKDDLTAALDHIKRWRRVQGGREEDGVREHPVAAIEHEGIRVQQ